MNQGERTTRRTLLGRGMTLLAATETVPLLVGRSALGVTAPEGTRRSSRAGVPDGCVLVVVQLTGGNDGLNTVIPLNNDDYARARPSLAIAARNTLKIDDAFGLHASLEGFRSIFDEGMLTIVHGVGYPNPNRSHFRSMDIWHSASPDGRQHTGWLGRYLDSTYKGQDTIDSRHGIALMSQLPLAMRGDRFRPVALRRPDMVSWNGDRIAGSDDEGTLIEMAHVRREALYSRAGAAAIHMAGRGPSRTGYPACRLSQSLMTVARMIAADMPTRIYYVSQTGYDTHTNQSNRHPRLLSELGGAMRAFVDDLRENRKLDRVTVMVFSEFGRRVAENASGGTDHGEAGPMFLIGAHVCAGFHGHAPSLAPDGRHRGDLAWTTDFRSVYAAILEDWLKADRIPVLGRGIKPINVLLPTT